MKLNLPDKLYYSIGEVSKAFGVNASLIRYWEQEFPIIKPKKNKKGNRYFTPEDIKNLKIIYHLVKEKGYTLQGAKDKLKGGNKEADQVKVEVIDKLKGIKKTTCGDAFCNFQEYCWKDEIIDTSLAPIDEKVSMDLKRECLGFAQDYMSRKEQRKALTLNLIEKERQHRNKKGKEL